MIKPAMVSRLVAVVDLFRTYSMVTYIAIYVSSVKMVLAVMVKIVDRMLIWTEYLMRD